MDGMTVPPFISEISLPTKGPPCLEHGRNVTPTWEFFTLLLELFMEATRSHKEGEEQKEKKIYKRPAPTLDRETPRFIPCCSEKLGWWSLERVQIFLKRPVKKKKHWNKAAFYLDLSERRNHGEKSNWVVSWIHHVPTANRRSLEKKKMEQERRGTENVEHLICTSFFPTLSYVAQLWRSFLCMELIRGQPIPGPRER